MRKISNLKEIQQRCLEILKYINNVCKENDIKYSLCAGTALGAIRHKGFIPWDDDIDIMMTRENYDKFIQIMDSTQNANYKCLHFGKDFPNYFYRFAKVVDLHTYVEEENFPRHKDMGLFVDIFPVDAIPEEMAVERTKKYAQMGVLHYIAASKKFVKSDKGLFRSILKFFIWSFYKIVGWKHLVKKSEKFLREYKIADCKYAGVYDEYEDREIMPKEIFDNLIEIDFEDTKFSLIENYDYYLTKLYGDYMTPPPEDKRQQHHIVAFKKD